ncbi:MAG: adenylate kinase [Chloroflexi bacterium]|nr:MAG: adenylate kinase [Chloroflexota bacterium]TMF71375.1 MAG: adenylate kinase [Chloroflexota bacterium]TMF77406.1 MAG: adenylate kinase [Chloroflexota bacterium]TMF92181.1 MAG: adenylate kinase [Chloroflexota bacterium]TMG46760.1 MAG: adenylate kinase [Chloroflexota bacterium]
MVAAAAQDPARRPVIGIIFGPPGSGKGTQAARIEKEFRLKHLSTGEILRAEVASGSPIGKEAGRIMAAGDLVPDELIVDIVRGRLPEAETGAGVLLDGFPRTVRQAQALDAMLADEGHTLDFVIALDVPEAELVERLLHRARVEGRADDTRQAIAERMHEYHKLTEAVLDHYSRQGVPVKRVDGLGSPEEVFGRIRRAIGISSV